MILTSGLSPPFLTNYQRSPALLITNQFLTSLIMQPRTLSKRRAAPDTEGLKVAQDIAHEVEERLG
jgi:hypothetical protein